MDAKRVGSLIAFLRRSKGLTQQQLADRIGVTNRAVSKWETGQGLPDVAVLPELARVLGCTVDELLAGELTRKGSEEPPAAEPPETPAPGMLLARMDDPASTEDLDAAAAACCTRPVVRWPRLVLLLIGIGGIAAGLWFAGTGLMGTSGQALRSALVVICGLICCHQAIFAGRLRHQLALDMRKNTQLEVYDTQVLWPKNGRTLSLGDLSAICVGTGSVTLIWDRVPTPIAVVVPETACTLSQPDFVAHLQQAASGATVSQITPPRLSRYVKGLLFALLGVLLLLPSVAVAFGVTSCISPTGKILMLQRDWETGVVTDLHSHTQFPYPVVGRMKEQWLTGDCCAITYQTIDGSTHVYLATYGDRGDGLSYYYVQSALYGTWRENDSVTSPGYQLRHDGEITGVQVTPPDRYGWTYDNNVQFGTIGLALCDEDGLPQWVVVLGRDYTFDEHDLPAAGSTIVLCPVSMDATAPITLTIYTPEDQQADENAAAEAAKPSFSRDIACDVTPGGVYFTWDGGITTSNPLSGDSCQQYGITEVGDLQPLVLKENGAAFFVEIDYNDIWIYCTNDRGQTWNSHQLFHDRDVRAVSDKLLGFTDDSFGYAAISTEYSPGAGIAVELYTTDDGGTTWQQKTIPTPQVGRGRAINGLAFGDAQNGIASLESGTENNWPYLFATTDAGNSWQEIEVPWEDTDAAWLRCIESLWYSDGRWYMQLTQNPQGRKVCTFSAEQLTGPWTCEKTEDDLR